MIRDHQSAKAGGHKSKELSNRDAGSSGDLGPGWGHVSAGKRGPLKQGVHTCSPSGPNGTPPKPPRQPRGKPRRSKPPTAPFRSSESEARMAGMGPGPCHSKNPVGSTSPPGLVSPGGRRKSPTRRRSPASVARASAALKRAQRNGDKERRWTRERGRSSVSPSSSTSSLLSAAGVMNGTIAGTSPHPAHPPPAPLVRKASLTSVRSGSGGVLGSSRSRNCHRHQHHQRRPSGLQRAASTSVSSLNGKANGGGAAGNRGAFVSPACRPSSAHQKNVSFSSPRIPPRLSPTVFRDAWLNYPSPRGSDTSSVASDRSVSWIWDGKGVDDRRVSSHELAARARNGLTTSRRFIDFPSFSSSSSCETPVGYRRRPHDPSLPPPAEKPNVTIVVDGDAGARSRSDCGRYTRGKSGDIGKLSDSYVPSAGSVAALRRAHFSEPVAVARAAELARATARAKAEHLHRRLERVGAPQDKLSSQDAAIESSPSDSLSFTPGARVYHRETGPMAAAAVSMVTATKQGWPAPYRAPPVSLEGARTASASAGKTGNGAADANAELVLEYSANGDAILCRSDPRGSYGEASVMLYSNGEAEVAAAAHMPSAAATALSSMPPPPPAERRKLFAATAASRASKSTPNDKGGVFQAGARVATPPTPPPFSPSAIKRTMKSPDVGFAGGRDGRGQGRGVGVVGWWKDLMQWFDEKLGPAEAVSSPPPQLPPAIRLPSLNRGFSSCSSGSFSSSCSAQRSRSTPARRTSFIARSRPSFSPIFGTCGLVDCVLGELPTNGEVTRRGGGKGKPKNKGLRRETVKAGRDSFDRRIRPSLAHGFCRLPSNGNTSAATATDGGSGSCSGDSTETGAKATSTAAAGVATATGLPSARSSRTCLPSYTTFSSSSSSSSTSSAAGVVAAATTAATAAAAAAAAAVNAEKAASAANAGFLAAKRARMEALRFVHRPHDKSKNDSPHPRPPVHTFPRESACEDEPEVGTE